MAEERKGSSPKKMERPAGCSRKRWEEFLSECKENEKKLAEKNKKKIEQGTAMLEALFSFADECPEWKKIMKDKFNEYSKSDVKPDDDEGDDEPSTFEKLLGSFKET